MNKIYLVVLLIAFVNRAKPQFSLELNAGAKSVAAYAKVLHYIGKNNRWSFYSSNRAAVNFDLYHPRFSTTDILAYNFRSGIGIAACLVASNSGFHSSGGLQYQKRIGSCSLYFLSTYELDKVARQENYLILLYKHKLSKKLKVVFQNESYCCILKWGYDQSLQRIKCGIEIRQTQVGLISETSQVRESHTNRLVNLGCFIKQSF